MGTRPQATVLSHDLLSAKQSTGEQGQSPLHPLEIINKASIQAPQLSHFFNFLLHNLTGLSCIAIE